MNKWKAEIASLCSAWMNRWAGWDKPWNGISRLWGHQTTKLHLTFAGDLSQVLLFCADACGKESWRLQLHFWGNVEHCGAELSSSRKEQGNTFLAQSETDKLLEMLSLCKSELALHRRKAQCVLLTALFGHWIHCRISGPVWQGSPEAPRAVILWFCYLLLFFCSPCSLLAACLTPLRLVLAEVLSICRSTQGEGGALAQLKIRLWVLLQHYCEI